MALLEFKNLPDTSTPINAGNLNNNFNELNNKIISLIDSGKNQNGSYIKYSNGDCFAHGIVNVVPTANTPVSYNVNLPVEFSKIENSWCIAHTGVPQNVEVSTEHTDTELSVILYRNNNTETGISWFAIGKWE